MTGILNPNIEKMLEVLLDHPNVGYTKNDIVDKAGISRSDLRKSWDILEENGIVVEKGSYGGKTLYRLNPDSDLVNHIGKVMDAGLSTEREETVEA
ncbi:MAG: winged helix-turn-helix domain-containing protein [Candidatus Nanohaloarchaea archaeon]